LRNAVIYFSIIIISVAHFVEIFFIAAVKIYAKFYAQGTEIGCIHIDNIILVYINIVDIAHVGTLLKRPLAFDYNTQIEHT